MTGSDVCPFLGKLSNMGKTRGLNCR